MLKMKRFKSLLLFTCVLLALFLVAGCSVEVTETPALNTQQTTVDLTENSVAPTSDAETQIAVEKGNAYASKDEVAAYLHAFNELPPNFITKKEAEELGWNSSEGNLWEVTDRQSIGGDRFGNREGLLPKAEGRQYYECDINYSGGRRGAERIVYSSDGLIYYTGDHYKSFDQLYQERRK